MWLTTRTTGAILRCSASVVQALQSKPDHEQVADFVKQARAGEPLPMLQRVWHPLQVVGASAGEKVALFAKRQLLGTGALQADA